MTATKTVSKECELFHKFIEEEYLEKLMYLAERLQYEWKYEKQDAINIIMNDLSVLGPVEDYSKANKIEVVTALGNNRFGVIQLTKSKVKYGVGVNE